MALRTRNKISASFSMSSMTDIVFLLLIFFIIVSTLISPNAIKVLLPSGSSKITDKQTISVSITNDLKYFVSGKEIAEGDLEQVLISELGGEPNPGIILHADKSIPLENAVKVLDIANRNKFQVVIATKAK